jgi:hypothetical protein
MSTTVLLADRATWVVKPRRQWDAFWNAGGCPREIVEIIAAAGFENSFRDVAAV